MRRGPGWSSQDIFVFVASVIGAIIVGAVIVFA
jgi:hypothetical protein